MEQGLTLTPLQPLKLGSLTACMSKQNYLSLYLIYSKGYRDFWNQQVRTPVNALLSSLPLIIFRLYNLKCPKHSLPREVSPISWTPLFFLNRYPWSTNFSLCPEPWYVLPPCIRVVDHQVACFKSWEVFLLVLPKRNGFWHQTASFSGLVLEKAALPLFSVPSFMCLFCRRIYRLLPRDLLSSLIL